MQDKIAKPILSVLNQDRTQKFVTIVLTLIALSFFGFFAINPTISTITKLRKEVSDSEFANMQLAKKIKNLSVLREQYSNLKNDISLVINAFPKDPNVPLLIAQIQAVAKNATIKITELQNFEVEIIRNNIGIKKQYYSYSFSLSGAGTYENISQFVADITDMERIVNIDTLNINKSSGSTSQSLGFTIQGIAFFKE